MSKDQKTTKTKSHTHLANVMSSFWAGIRFKGDEVENYLGMVFWLQMSAVAAILIFAIGWHST